jgi:hypothetical protein
VGTLPDSSAPNQGPPVDNDRLLVGVAEMAAEAGQPPRRMYHWLATGRIKCARKMGHQHVAGRRQFRRELGLD